MAYERSEAGAPPYPKPRDTVSTKIVVAGHSAGGQLATRYEMTNKVHSTPGVSITYVVANPSSYAWPAAVRPLKCSPKSSAAQTAISTGSRPTMIAAMAELEWLMPR